MRAKAGGDDRIIENIINGGGDIVLGKLSKLRISDTPGFCQRSEQAGLRKGYSAVGFMTSTT